MIEGQKGERNGNITLLTKFVRALLGRPMLQSITERWDDEDDFREYPDRKLPAFRIIMMTLKRTNNLNQTIDLARSSEEVKDISRKSPKTRTKKRRHREWTKDTRRLENKGSTRTQRKAREM